MERPKDSMSEVKFFDVSNTNTLGHVLNLKPCVETSWNSHPARLERGIFLVPFAISMR